MYIIGENIHIISEKVKEALKNRDSEFFMDLAVKQVEAGAKAIFQDASLIRQIAMPTRPNLEPPKSAIRRKVPSRQAAPKATAGGPHPGPAIRG